MSEIGDAALSLPDVVWSNVDKTVAREFCFDEVMKLKGIDCGCVGKNDVFSLVELIAVIGALECSVLFGIVDMCDAVVFPVIETIGWGWFVVLISVVFKGSVANAFDASVGILLSRFKIREHFERGKDQKYKKKHVII